MGIILWIVMGLVAGAIARAILPGRQGGGWLVTMALGVAGAVAGGLLAGRLFNVDLGGFVDTRTWLLAIG
ncbi:MAG: GlsB/YeaQ/YmgE family stress response membrane protein, partial [Rhodoglobus sp.]